MSALATLLGNGVGSFFGQCYWCKSPSPAVPAHDDLRILAAATAAGWRAERCGEGRHELVCRRCQRVYGPAPKAA